MRKNFDEHDDYRGGRVNPDAPKPRLRYPCFAANCPMPGTIFTGTTDKPGSCAWHYATTGADVPRVTQVLRDWACIADEVRAARATFNDPDVATDPNAIAERFAAAWARLQPLAGDWAGQLEPTPRETYGAWAHRIEAFLGGRVVASLSTHPRRIA